MPYCIDLIDVNFSHGEKTLFKDVTLQFPGGDITILLGRSGSGKSTLLEIAAGLITPNKGKVLWDHDELKNQSRHRIHSLRRDVGFVFQQHALISNISVFQNIALPLKYHTLASISDIKTMINRQLEKFGILHLADQLPETLSVGQARLVSIARALIMRPEFLFLDEPLSGLDPVTAQTVTEHLVKLCRSHDMSVFMVSHITQFIKQIDARIVVLENQRVKSYNSFNEAVLKSEDKFFMNRLNQSSLVE